ncbi:putative toxin-antitoxin system toxin component, PIN family [Runella sp.]|jgi:putative PIN family toxin of toxin-antitoxin system|uniref:putative toxin-antitoxin system toxin component, PIN family n=1 Tax=Runella sp. TaxID=1960881 RepID=UPI00262C2E20|nr:putative toxin-antitoxin system toxin component, PIN family [Runella sp.]
MIKAVIDTNILLNSIPKKGSLRWLYDAFQNEEFIWVFSNEIITEYAKVINREFSKQAMEVVFSILLTAVNTQRFEPSYKWQLVSDDPDDNKFVDCALGANVDYLVSNDRHLRNLLKIKDLFPPVPVVTPVQFKKIIGL